MTSSGFHPPDADEPSIAAFRCAFERRFKQMLSGGVRHGGYSVGNELTVRSWCMAKMTEA